MAKVKIKIITIGQMPPDFNKQKIESWFSKIFELADEIENYSLEVNSDSHNWGYSDLTMLSQIPKSFEGDFILALTNVPLQHNWYARRLSDNKVVVSFFEMKDILRNSNIPLENLILRVLYAYSLVYKRKNDKIPVLGETSHFTHDETKGCLFDMTGIKTEIIHSCDSPIVCTKCIEKLKTERVSDEVLKTTLEEIRKIKKTLFYQITDFVKMNPIWAIIISGISAIILGAIGSILGTIVYN